MRFMGLLAGLAATCGGLGSPLAAQGGAAATEALFEAAGRGETAPIARALAARPEADLAVLLRAQLAAARFDRQAGREPALTRLAAGRDPERRRWALGLLTEIAFANGDYAAAARDGRAFAEALAAAGRAEDAAAAGRTWRLAALLAGRPAQRAGAIAAASIPAHRDRVGLSQIDVAVNGQRQEAVVDTGANLSVLSAGAARRLGVELLGAATDVSNGVEGTVPVRIGIAARLEIAGTMLTDVPVLIIDDANLTFPLPGGYSIEAIIGLPVLRALGRVQVSDGGFAVLAPAATPAGPANLHASGNDLYVDVELGGRPVPLHLDTGADATSLSALFATAFPQAVAALGSSETRSMGAGGARTQPSATWRAAPLALAGRRLALPALSIALPAPGPAPRRYGTLGSDALRAFQSYTIDFTAMRLELGEPVAAPPAPAPG